MDVSFFNTHFALCHATVRGHITEAQTDQVLDGINRNRIGADDLLQLITAAGAAQPQEAHALVLKVERTGTVID
jgi:hypothetical protein